LFPFYAYLGIKGWWDSMDDFVIAVIACFILFRFFDILKPFPINLIDKKLKNGLGVLLDDVVAGIFSSLIVWITIFYIL